jgi:Flp pilus assembly protein TadD
MPDGHWSGPERKDDLERRKLNSTPIGAAVILLTVATQAFAASPFQTQLSYGVQMAQRGLWAEALFRFQQAAKLDPQSGRAVGNLAVAYEALGKFPEAKTAYEKAVQLDPASPDLKRNQARFLEFFSGKAKAPAAGTAPGPAPVSPPPPTPSIGGDR